MIYLDYAATTKMSDTALKVFTEVAQHYFGNSNSLHDQGSSALQIKQASARTIAKTLNVDAEDLYFTSGATESNRVAISRLIKSSTKNGKHCITTQLEHASVTEVFEELEKEGFEVTYLKPNSDGIIELEELKKAICPDTIVASIQHVNSEIGVVQNLEEIGEILKSKDVRFHSDCVQSYGRIPIDTKKFSFDALSISGHKIYGPKGVGAFWLNPEFKLDAINKSGVKKSGTSNSPGIAAFAAAAKEIFSDLEPEQERIQKLKEHFLNELRKSNIEFEIDGGGKLVPNILGIRFMGMEGQFMMLELSQAGVGISTGSACQVGSLTPSVAMLALNKSEQEAREFVRFSFGKYTTVQEIEAVVPKIKAIIERHFKKMKREKSFQ